MRTSRQLLATVAVAFVMLGVGAHTVGAQDVVISSDGPNVTSSNAGADNTRIQRQPGNQQAVANDGSNNREAKRAARNNNDKSNNKNNKNKDNAPAEDPAAYADPNSSNIAPEPAAAPAAPEAAAQPATGGQGIVALPSTGVGGVDLGSIVSVIVAAGSVAAGYAGRKRVA